MNQEIQLITVQPGEEPYITATKLAIWLEYNSADAVSQIVRRRKDDFNDKEVIIDDKGDMLLNFEGALKVCIFSKQPKAKDSRDNVISVYRSWREGTAPSYEKVSGTQQALMLANAVATLAKEQLRHERLLEQHGEVIENIDHRVAQLEAKQNKGFISEAQASQITVKVREIGQLLSANNGRGMYGSVYTNMYQRFGITTYKNIPADMFDDVMSWLNSIKQKAISELSKQT